MIRVFDAYGRELFITKQAWRDSVLLGHLKKVWDRPDELSGTIIQSLQDGFGADLLKPAEHLAEIDPNAERGAVVLAIVYRDQKRLDDSERVLRTFILKHGESGVALTNLAKIHSERGQPALTLETLWHGLELDPNQDNGLGWYEAIHRENHGPEAGLAALRRIAALPGSWRARLWLARDALGRKALDEALALYREALALAPKPVPADLLMQLSGDLGNHGHLPEILQLASPLFDPVQHGIRVGNNLIKANVDLGQLDAARALLDQLYALKRPDWQQNLSFWDNELAQAHVAATVPPARDEIAVAMLTGDDPVWLPESSPANELFPASEQPLTRVAFLGSSAELADTSQPAVQRSNAQGRMSRALPVFLAEQVRFNLHARARTIVPWMTKPSPSFVLSGVPWSDADAAQHARAGDGPSDYIVVTHLRTAAEPWSIDLRLIRTIDAVCLASTSTSLNSKAPEAEIRALAETLLGLLAQHAEIGHSTCPDAYSVPTGNDFGDYLLRLEQLLTVRCAATSDTAPQSLSGEREILDGTIQLCLRNPANLVPRVLLMELLKRMHKIRPHIVPEFQDKVALLNKEKPLASVPQGVIDRMVSEVFGARPPQQ